MNRRVNEQQQRQQKMLESNMRNEKRLLRYRARVEEMARYKDSPEHFLAMGGFMNESIQEYIFSHNYTLTTDPTQVDPDNMTYEVGIWLVSNSWTWGTRSVRCRRDYRRKMSRDYPGVPTRGPRSAVLSVSINWNWES